MDDPLSLLVERGFTSPSGSPRLSNLFKVLESQASKLSDSSEKYVSSPLSMAGNSSRFSNAEEEVLQVSTVS